MYSKRATCAKVFTKNLSKAAPTPTTNRFRKYIEELVRPTLLKHVSNTQVSVFIDLLTWLEQQRFDYSGRRAFSTKPLSNSLIAETFQVTERSVRRWMALMERHGFIERVFRKNTNHRYRNLLNRFRFCGFYTWFNQQKTDSPDTQSPPNKKDLESKSISTENSQNNDYKTPPFPASGGVNYDPYWKHLALKHLPSGSGRPCMTMIAERFRQNLRSHTLPLSHGSITARWIKFCQRAKAVN